MNELEVINDYKNGMLNVDIMKKYNLTNYYLNKILNSHNVTRRSHKESMKIMNKQRKCGKKYSYNEDYFKTWSSNMAYILGFISADGNISKDAMTIGLQKSDEVFLRMIVDELEYSGEIKIKQSKANGKVYESAYLIIYSKVMCSDLKELGIVEAKSFIVEMTNKIPKEYISDFIRGYFDGDGSVGRIIDYKGFGTTQIRLRINSGSQKLLEQFRDYFDSMGVKHINVKKRNKTNIYELLYSTKQAIKIHNIIYYSSNNMCLSRKRQKLEELIQEREVLY